MPSSHPSLGLSVFFLTLHDEQEDHDEFGDAAVNVPQQSHNTRHNYTLRRLILALRAAWGTAVRMEPTAHLGQRTNNPTWMRTTLAHTAAMTMLLRLFLMTDRDWSPDARTPFGFQCSARASPVPRLKFFCAKKENVQRTSCRPK